MTAVSGKPKKLSNLQATLLQLFDQNLSDDELVEIKSLLSNYFYEKAQQEADRVMSERSQTLETLKILAR